MKGHVLYVDDDASNLAVFAAALEEALPVLTARSGTEALQLLEQHDVAVLLTDQRMPGMTGVELMQVVQQGWPDTARVLVTAYSDLDEAVEAINKGRIHRYVRKPWEPVELKAMLESARDGYLLRRQFDALQVRLRETERVYALGVVAASVAHDLRNPLSAITSNLDLLQFHFDGDPMVPRDGALEALKGAFLGTQAMVDLVASMQLTTRRRGSDAVDLKQVVELALRTVRGALQQRGTLEVTLEPVPPVKGTTTRLGQVVMNLLVNALEALPRSDHGRVTVHLHAQDDSVVLAVSDSGQGISPADLQRIFDPFFTTKTEGGTGLGLAISRSIVEECGGRLEARSQAGEGSSFTVTLPAHTG